MLHENGIELRSSPRLDVDYPTVFSGDKVVGEGTIYPILGRLTRDGLLQAEWQASAAHPRKYYRLTDAGTRRLRVMVQDWRMFASKIDRLVQAAAQEGGK